MRVFFPPDSTVVHPAVNIEDKVYDMEEAPVLEPLGHFELCCDRSRGH